MKLPQKKLERKLYADGYQYICAVDEVGMGCLAGPVVVCAVGMTNTFHAKIHAKLRGVRESKLLNARQRERFAHWLTNDQQLVYTLASCSSKTIDRLNIYQASRRAMRAALKKIQPPIALKTIVLVDGNKKIDGLKHDQRAITAGDRKVFAIACASVIAKVHRDRLMRRAARRYPGYGFDRHVGYGTKAHYQALATLGPSPLHRRSFRLH